MAAPTGLGKPLFQEMVDGYWHSTWVVVEDETTTTTSEWSIGISNWSTVTVTEGALAGTGNANTIQTAFGTVPTWVIDGDGHQGQAPAPGASVRIGESRRIQARDELLYVRSGPDINLSGDQTITTRVTVIRGHRG